MSGIRIAHLINPVDIDEDRDLYFQQPFTYESMKIAADFTNIEVNFYPVVYEEDAEFAKKYFDFIIPDNLERSTLDGDYKVVRKLPYFTDMLDLMYGHCDGEDYFIQTNADIILQPYFYDFVANLIESGQDSFCINKRIIPEDFRDGSLVEMWTCPGKKHAGLDCFVFRRELYPKFDIGEVVMASAWSEATLMTNMIKYAKNFDVYKNCLATLHLGDRRIWVPQNQNDYRIQNTNEFARVLKKFSKKDKSILKHSAIIAQLVKLKYEVNGYRKEVYSKDCWDLIK